MGLVPDGDTPGAEVRLMERPERLEEVTGVEMAEAMIRKPSSKTAGNNCNCHSDKGKGKLEQRFNTSYSKLIYLADPCWQTERLATITSEPDRGRQSEQLSEHLQTHAAS